jgi:hypothetical protein
MAIRRPTLSGRVFLTEPESEEGSRADVPADQHVKQEATTVTLTTGGDAVCKPMTESMDRRINEAAQFAAAVGDEAAEIIIIEDHDDDDDDDDDDDATLEVKTDCRSVGSVAGSLAEKTTLVPSTPATTPSTATPTSLETASPMVGRPFKTRPLPWTIKGGFLDRLPTDGSDGQSTFIYKGIHSNPPDIVKHGIQRGNYAQLHRKAWLEVSDKYHRYGKNLRLYYRHWEKLGCPFHLFFDWLDSKGEAAGEPLPFLEDCLRAQLDSDTVLYITNPDVTERYVLGVATHAETGRGLILDAEGDPVVTGSDGWIFVLRDNRLYGARKITSVTGTRSKQRFHHSSFFGGKAVEAAGIFITDEHGYLTRLFPHSGHYRPGEGHMQRVLFFLYHHGVDLRSFEMDIQQILHVARDIPKNTADAKPEKKKKIESLCLQPAVLVACYLAHKARFIGEGIFSKLHQIRNSGVTSVTEALELIDDGGCW